MGETIRFNPEAEEYNLKELAKDPIGASDEVGKLMKLGKHEEAHKLLKAIITEQGAYKEEEPKQAMTA
ncbi:hypothetical protein KJ785_02980 [Patescibacteria group bacterium]|nr:hypothetical protein [Patescibacteria group bacterium]